jgi:hypothetical protein
MYDYPTFPAYDPTTTVLLYPSDDAQTFEVSLLILCCLLAPILDPLLLACTPLLA